MWVGEPKGSKGLQTTDRGELARRLEREPVVGPVREALRAAGVPRAWLVGGVVRDAAWGRPGPAVDVDVAVAGNGEGPARAVAARLGGTAFALDEAQGAWRVALGRPPAATTVDVIPLRAPDLQGDLRGRDFTVNAVAFDLLGPEGVVDPLGGLEDLAAGVLRLCSGRALADDPVRVLRAYRFRAGLDLSWEPGLAAELARWAAGLRRVAPERVRTEWFAVLGLPGGARQLRAMVDEGVLQQLFPFVEQWRGFDQGEYHAYDLLEHSVRTAEAAEELAREGSGLPRSERIPGHLDQELEQGLTRKALLVFAAFFHDVAKPRTVRVEGGRRRFLTHEVEGGQQVGRLLETLRAGRRARRAAQRVVAAHLRLFQLAHQAPPTPRARMRYLHDLGDEVPEALLLSLADERATGPAAPAWDAVWRTAGELLAAHWRRLGAREIRPLLRGRDLLVELGLSEGPLVGEVLRRVAEAERDGRVSSRKEALALARRWLQERDAPGG
ncbi:MAG: HD domain-containing protein [Deferrisomatales bacterium]